MCRYIQICAPKWPQEFPRWPQEGPKRAQAGPKRPQDGPDQASRKREQPQEAPRWSQDGPKEAPRWPKWPKMSPRWSQDKPKVAPRWSQDGPKEPCEAILGLIELIWSPDGHPSKIIWFFSIKVHFGRATLGPHASQVDFGRKKHTFLGRSKVTAWLWRWRGPLN